MRRARWLAPWKESREKPVIYHCLSRVVERRFALGEDEREKFRAFLRKQEDFTGCRVLAYCVMSNHFHVLLEVPPMPERPDGSGRPGLADRELVKRLRAIYSEDAVAMVAKELADAHRSGNEAHVEEIHARYTYRMHNLSEFMKTLLQRFTQWFNTRHKRSGTLWEERFKSVIVESGIAARTMAAYMDLNPVRAGMVEDPAEYRWSSYGEAVGGAAKGNGKKAREGLVRACLSHEGAGLEAERWPEVSRSYRQLMGLALQRRAAGGVPPGRMEKVGQGMTAQENQDSAMASTLSFGSMLRHRVRYFTDGAVIGSRAFVNEAFARARERFSPGRKCGARRLRGNARPAAGTLWSLRDLRVDI